MIFTLTVSQANAATNFEGHTHQDGLNYLLKKDAIVPTTNANQTVTRAEFASYLVKSLKLTEVNDKEFTDVPSNHPYYDDIKKAVTADIVSGYGNNTFEPNQPISRLHMAVMLDRLMAYLELEKPDAALSFNDADAIYGPYKDIIARVAAVGIIQGSNGNFMPNDNATIGQSSSFIVRTMKLAKDPDALNPSGEVKPSEKPGTGNNGNENEKPEQPEKPTEPEKPTTPPVNNKFMVQNIEHGRLNAGTGYATLAGAKKAMTTSTQVITQNGKIIDMNAGFVVTKIYRGPKSETINDSVAVGENTEMEFISSNGSQVKVNLAGQVFTYNIADLDLIPFAMSPGRAYYTNKGGELVHTLFKHSSKQYYASYVVGKAPGFMREGEKYYSWNGIHFSDSRGVKAGESYNYYQFLPARSKTNYTAAEIDTYIMQQLKNLQASGSAMYKDAPTKSKLIGLGAPLKRIEAKYNINAMLILALAQHESAYGMSKHAQDLNNLFGLYVYDTNPLNKNFPTIEDNVNELVNKFWQPNYITPGGMFANGGVVGSKALGFNIKYASDPFWGAKIAGHYFRADKMMGYKDAGNPYKIGLTAGTNLAMRSTASNNSSVAFTYKRSGMPVIISDDTSSASWYGLLSDKFGVDQVYLPKTNVRVIPTVQ